MQDYLVGIMASAILWTGIVVRFRRPGLTAWLIGVGVLASAFWPLAISLLYLAGVDWLIQLREGDSHWNPSRLADRTRDPHHTDGEDSDGEGGGVIRLD